MLKKWLSALLSASMLMTGIGLPVLANESEPLEEMETTAPSIEMYRLYNPNSGEHFYTQKNEEKNSLINIGWKDEGIGWIAPSYSSTPVYRLYNQNAGDHHYTLDNSERSTLIDLGWKDEGIGWYSADNNKIPLYRQYNPNAIVGTHNYTSNFEEHSYLINHGWNDEGIAWYGLKEFISSNTTGSNTTGSNTTGSNTTGSNTTGSNTTGSNTTGSNTTGSNTTGSNIQFQIDKFTGIAEEEKGGTTCSIVEAGYENGYAFALINTDESSLLSFDFLDENTSIEQDVLNPNTVPLARVTKQISSYCEMKKIEVPVNTPLPEYFLLRVVLYKDDGSKACPEFYTIQYTRKYKEFKNKSVEDFNNNIVLNFDDSNNDNFAVMQDEVQLPVQSKTVNILQVTTNTDENDLVNFGKEIKYTFINPDNQVQSLTMGDKVIAADIEGNFSTFVVGNKNIISTQEGILVEIIPQDFDVSDFYKLIDVNSEINSSNHTEKAIIVGEEERQYPGQEGLEAYLNEYKNLEVIKNNHEEMSLDSFKDEDIEEMVLEDIEPIEEIGIELKHEQKAQIKQSKLEFEYKFNKDLKFSVNGLLQSTGNFKLIYDLELFGEDYIEASISLENKIDALAKVDFAHKFEPEADADSHKEKAGHQFPAIPIPLPLPSTVWTLRPAIDFSLEIKASAQTHLMFKQTFGFSYKTGTGLQKINKQEKFAEAKADGSIQLDICPLLNTGVSILGSTITGELGAGVGAKLKGDIYSSQFHATTQDKKHKCDLCLAITGKAYLKITANLKAKIGDWSQTLAHATWKSPEAKILFSGEVDKLYISLLSGENNIFDDQDIPKMGLGDCPNIAYKVDITISDEAGEEINDISINLINVKNNYANEINSPGKVYLIPGTYTVTANINGIEVNKKFTVSNKAQKIKLLISNQTEDKDKENSDWKGAYLNYIDKLDKKDQPYYALINVNNDNIPELYIEYPWAAAGGKLCTYANGKVITQIISRGGLTYIPGENLFLNSNGNMGSYYDRIYRIQNGQFDLIGKGEWGEKYDANYKPVLDSNGYPIYEYRWEGIKMSEDEYKNHLNNIFDETKSVYIDTSQQLNYKEIINKLSN